MARRRAASRFVGTMFVVAGCGRFGFAPPREVDARVELDGARGTDGGSDGAVDGLAPPPRLVFATPTAMLGGVGALAQLDIQCTADANGAGHAGSFRVVLATAGANVTTRITLDQGRTIERADGVVVATDSTFFTASHSASLDVDVTGTTIVVSTDAWTDFTSDGVALASDCVGWTDSSTNNMGGIGSLIALDATWASSGTGRCNRVAHLICIEQ